MTFGPTLSGSPQLYVPADFCYPFDDHLASLNHSLSRCSFLVTLVVPYRRRSLCSSLCFGGGGRGGLFADGVLLLWLQSCCSDVFFRRLSGYIYQTPQQQQPPSSFYFFILPRYHSSCYRKYFINKYLLVRPWSNPGFELFE